jgi:hypothetical protein
VGAFFGLIEAMTVLSLSPAETARKGVQAALQRLQEPGTGISVAAAMGVSESTISRLKTERMEEVVTLLAHLGLKVVPTDFRCVNPEAYAFLVQSHQRVMAKAPQLIWEQDE